MKEHKDKSLEKQNIRGAEITRDDPVFVPSTDIYEKNDAILVRCDMPGVDQNEIDITLESNELTITGRQAVAKPDGVELLMGEYDSGVFRRTFNIPQLIDRNTIKARLHNGVLDIELPKAEQAKPRKIEVATEG